MNEIDVRCETSITFMLVMMIAQMPKHDAGGRGLLSCLVLAVVLLGACSEAEPQASPRPRPLLADFVNGGTCEPLQLGRLPADAGCATEVTGDADGDGSTDTLTVYARIGEDLRPRSWHMRLTTSDATSDQELDAGTKFSYPRAIGSADVNGDGRSEWFVKTLDLAGHGTAWKQLNLFVFQGSKLAIVTSEGDPLALRIGGITRMGEGVACPERRLALLRAEAQNIRNTRWDTSARIFMLRGTKARFVERTTGALTLTDYNDPALDRYYQVNCDSLSISA
jgi:hypothetical protein